MQNAITTYILNYLKPRLESYNLPAKLISILTEDIRNRLISIIYRWEDFDFRKTLLVTGQEEGFFYKPNGDMDIRSMVVLAIRNSLIEDLSSTKEAANRYNLDAPAIPDNDIPSFTGEAIRFFERIDLKTLSNNITPVDNDPFGNLSDEYPVAWNALKHLANSNGLVNSFQPLEKEPLVLGTVKNLSKLNNSSAPLVLSGMDANIDDRLLDILLSIGLGKISHFFTDSFKWITRHPSKLFYVMEYILRAEGTIVSFNFLITNGYIARRKNLIRPAHSTKEIDLKFSNTNGLVKKHKEILEFVQKSL